MGQRLARLARHATIILLWLLVLWNSWHYRALFSDGSLFFLDIVQRGGFHSYSPLARQYAIGVMQIPIVAGLWLGWPGLAKPEFTAALSLLGLGGGLFIVPIVSVLQHRPSAQTKGAVQGAAVRRTHRLADGWVEGVVGWGGLEWEER